MPDHEGRKNGQNLVKIAEIKSLGNPRINLSRLHSGLHSAGLLLLSVRLSFYSPSPFLDPDQGVSKSSKRIYLPISTKTYYELHQKY